jgi:hypothetical protein
MKKSLLIVALIILSWITPWAIPLVVAVVVWQYWKFRSSIQRWDIVARCVAILGMLSNFAVVVANHGLMPVVDIGYVPSGHHWKPATRSDHLIFLCDRIHLFGPTWPIMESVGKSLADWSITAPLGDFLMAGSMVSIGDLLITVALLLWLTEWLTKRRAAWRLWERQIR